MLRLAALVFSLWNLTARVVRRVRAARLRRRVAAWRRGARSQRSSSSLSRRG